MARVFGKVVATCVMFWLLWVPPLGLTWYLIWDCGWAALSFSWGLLHSKSLGAALGTVLILFLYIVIQWLIPLGVFWWVFNRRIIYKWLESWWWWAKGLFVFYTADIFLGLALSHKDFDFTVNLIWLVSFGWFLWLVLAMIFYLKLEDDEKTRTALPRWVGNEGSIRHNFWDGFVSTVLIMTRRAWDLIPQVVVDNSFGAAHEASLSEIEKAGLL